MTFADIVLTLALVLAFLVALLGPWVLAGWWLWRRWSAEWPKLGPPDDEGPEAPAVQPPKGPPPIVLVHGLLGFDHMRLWGREVPYFRGIAHCLASAGATVYTAKVPPLASVPDRAQALREFVASLPHDQVNLVAHSMGGLDARYAVARLGLDAQVGALITIATPHRGTPLADLGVKAPVRALRALVGRVGLHTEAVDWLTSTRTTSFNGDIVDVDGVTYASVVAKARRSLIATNPVLLSGLLYLELCAGPNDGLVPVNSQEGGEIWQLAEADHWAQIGWSHSFDPSFIYLGLISELRRRGLG